MQAEGHKDAECPLNKGKPVNHTQVLMADLGGASGPKAQEAMVVEVHATMRTGQSKLLMILDTACASSVVGYPTLTAYMEEADRTGVEYSFEPDGECFKFGASRVFKADFAAWLPVKVGSLWIVVRVAVVACDVPFLLGRPALKKLKAKIDLGGEHVGFGVLNGEDFALVQAQGGHPAVAVFPDGGAKPPRLDWAQVRDLGRNNGVWYPSAVRAYMAEPEIKGEGKKLFYAKKLPPAVQDMLGAKQVSSEAFLGWWKGTKVRGSAGAVLAKLE